LLGDYYLDLLKEFNKAINIYCDIDCIYPNKYYQSSRYFSEFSGYYDYAIKYLSTGIQLCPTDYMLWYKLAQNYIKKNEFNKADLCFESCIYILNEYIKVNQLNAKDALYMFFSNFNIYVINNRKNEYLSNLLFAESIYNMIDDITLTEFISTTDDINRKLKNNLKSKCDILDIYTLVKVFYENKGMTQEIKKYELKINSLTKKTN